MPTRALTDTFLRFFESEKSGGMLLILCTVVSIALTNSVVGPGYLAFWQKEVFGMSIEHWINDGLMAIFFLLIGLELERELYVGELSRLRNALLPIFAAIGGMMIPALWHFVFNQGLPTQDGIGIPMATDIAFALGVLSLLGNRVPASLKVFVVAFAVIDDLGAIVMIALFYTAKLNVGFLLGGLGVWFGLLALNRIFRVSALPVYLIGGALLWFLMLKSGVHATIAGVMLAFAIPFWSSTQGKHSPSHDLEHFLHKPAAFLILPLFALANTGIVLSLDWMSMMATPNSIGIIGGLVLGKPAGVFVISLAAVLLGFCQLPPDLQWRHVFGAGLLGGIGFTMSIFITNLAFATDPAIINASKIAILCASILAGALSYYWLVLTGGGAPRPAE